MTRHPDAVTVGEPNEELLARYLHQALTRIEAGEDVRPRELCREHPELAAPLADALQMTEDLPELHRAASVADPLEAVVLRGRYQLERRLGMGAMGVVYRATDLELKRTVAVKLLAKDFAEDIAEQRFEREAELLAALQHPHIVSVFDRGRSARGMPFLVMELLDGVSLSVILAAYEQDAAAASVGPEAEWLAAKIGGGAPPERSFLRMAVRWSAELASGLRAAHECGVFHRDIKPSNVFILRDYRAVLLDFGIAARPQDGRLTASETVLGTPWYMPPEQAAGRADARRCRGRVGPHRDAVPPDHPPAAVPR